MNYIGGVRCSCTISFFCFLILANHGYGGQSAACLARLFFVISCFAGDEKRPAGHCFGKAGNKSRIKYGWNTHFVPVLSVFYPCSIPVLSGFHPKQFRACLNLDFLYCTAAQIQTLRGEFPKYAAIMWDWWYALPDVRFPLNYFCVNPLIYKMYCLTFAVPYYRGKVFKY